METAKQILDKISADHSLSDNEIAKRINALYGEVVTSQPTIYRIRHGSECFSTLYIAICRLRDSFKRQRKLAA